MARGESSVGRVRLRGGKPAGVLAERCSRFAARWRQALSGGDKAFSQAGSQRRPHIARADSAPAGRRSTKRLGHNNSRGSGTRQTAWAMAGSASRGVHPEDGTLSTGKEGRRKIALRPRYNHTDYLCRKHPRSNARSVKRSSLVRTKKPNKSPFLNWRKIPEPSPTTSWSAPG